MRLVVSPKLEAEDVEALQAAIDQPVSLLQSIAAKSMVDVEDALVARETCDPLVANIGDVPTEHRGDHLELAGSPLAVEQQRFLVGERRPRLTARIFCQHFNPLLDAPGRCAGTSSLPERPGLAQGCSHAHAAAERP